VTALLSSQPGSLLLLENPEAHLHPQGQVKMGELMARAANAGVQIICETHSDHILNGIRLASKGVPETAKIDPANVALHFFQRSKEVINKPSVEILTPELDEEGRLDFWPEGFFDEWGKSLDKLLKGRD
jgi:predicted ATPase